MYFVHTARSVEQFDPVAVWQSSNDETTDLTGVICHSLVQQHNPTPLTATTVTVFHIFDSHCRQHARPYFDARRYTGPSRLQKSIQVSQRSAHAGTELKSTDRQGAMRQGADLSATISTMQVIIGRTCILIYRGRLNGGSYDPESSLLDGSQQVTNATILKVSHDLLRDRHPESRLPMRTGGIQDRLLPKAARGILDRRIRVTSCDESNIFSVSFTRRLKFAWPKFDNYL